MSDKLPKWSLGPFSRIEGVNPVLKPDKSSVFDCPVRNERVKWEELHVFNPAAVVHKGKVVLLYRAEDASGAMKVGGHTSRIGYASSSDGFNFSRRPEPILFPTQDEQLKHEWPTGCEDPRVVQREDGLFIMTYTQATGWNEKEKKWGFILGIATSRNLVEWRKHGSAFAKAFDGRYGKSGKFCQHKSASIVCREQNGNFTAERIKGLYWMYWHNGYSTFCATSNDLLDWVPVENPEGGCPLEVLPRRKGYFDSGLTECGPQALLKDAGILVIYNGANSTNPDDMCKDLKRNAYSAGQALFSKDAPSKLLDRLDKPFLKPEAAYEKVGQCPNECVFVEGLVHHRGKWMLYYGGTDAVIGVAICND